MDRQWWSMMFNEGFMMIYVLSHSVGMHITMGSGGSSRERWEKGRSTSAEWPLIEQWPLVTKNLVDWWKKGCYIYLSYTTQWLLRISMILIHPVWESLSTLEQCSTSLLVDYMTLYSYTLFTIQYIGDYHNPRDTQETLRSGSVRERLCGNIVLTVHNLGNAIIITSS
jgi:hypothetical protein